MCVSLRDTTLCPRTVRPIQAVPIGNGTQRAITRDDGSYEELKADIEKNGIGEELIIFFGRNGKVKIGEGNHRHQIALELGIEKIPVRFEFWRSVEGHAPYGKAFRV